MNTLGNWQRISIVQLMYTSWETQHQEWTRDFSDNLEGYKLRDMKGKMQNKYLPLDRAL